MHAHARPTLILALAAVVASPTAAQLQSRVVVSDLNSPLAYVQDPTQANVHYVVQKGGLVRVVQDGTLGGNALDLSGSVLTDGERGLLGMEFGPDGKAYVNYIDLSGNTRISRFSRAAGNPFALDAGSREDIITIAQPAGRNNHKGGTVRFGPDGMLYIATGDGGAGNDPDNFAQNPTSLLGKMLRINPLADDFAGDATRNYAIPTSNPFFGADAFNANDEIWAFGYRNPFKFSFDSATGDMLVGDVGQSAQEEINFEPANTGGRNYGWRVREGTGGTGLSGGPFVTYTDPIYAYSHNSPAPGTRGTVIGGYVYRGTELEDVYQGRYFFGDFVRGRIWSLNLTDSSVIDHTVDLGGTAFIGSIVSIDQGSRGELYWVDIAGGRVIEIVPEPATVLALLGGLAALATRRRRARS